MEKILLNNERLKMKNKQTKQNKCDIKKELKK